jgi:hypothetical protein
MRNVLLNLCKLSPALSGAVARGLAPSSSYAQDTIKAYRNKTAAPNIKSDPGEMAKHTSHDVKTRMVTPPQRRIKREIETVRIPSDDEDDLVEIDELFKPTPRPQADFGPSFATSSSSKSQGSNAGMKSEWPNPSRLPVRHSAHDVARDRAQPTNVKTEQGLRSRKCKHCEKQFGNEQYPCVYHPGRKVVAENEYGNRMPVYNCCRRSVYESGCVTGTHVAEPVDGLDQLRQSTGWSPTATARDPKRPKYM